MIDSHLESKCKFSKDHLKKSAIFSNNNVPDIILKFRFYSYLYKIKYYFR